jgi:hypothetical protein
MTAENIFGEKFDGVTKRVTAPANDDLRQVAGTCRAHRHQKNVFKEPVMIQAANIPQLTSAKPRSGMSSIAELMPRLIRQYELQAEMKKRATASPSQPSNPAAATITLTTAPAQQTTFGWE